MYNPLSLLNLFKKNDLNMDELDGLYVAHEFMSDHDIEDASPESFLTQAEEFH